MRLTLLIATLFVVNFSFAQDAEQTEFHLENAIVVGQMDNSADRYSIEVNLTQLLANNGVKSMASLNLMKLGSDSQQLASDSVASMAKEKGFNTFVLVSVRGYDKRYKASTSKEDFLTSLGRANLWEIYQQDIVSVTFEFKFFQNGEVVYIDTIKCGNAGSREKVLKKFRKKVTKRLIKKWK